MVAPPTAWTIPTPLVGYENTLHDMDLARDYLTDVALRLKQPGWWWRRPGWMATRRRRLSLIPRSTRR